jgi:hypothetical protein
MKTGASMRRSVLTIVLGAGPLLGLHAQAADTAKFPPVPTGIPLVLLPADPLDSGFGAWRHTPLPRHNNVAAAWTLRAGDWDFLIGTPRAMDAMGASRVIDTTLANCRRPLNLSAEDSARVSTAHPWSPFDSVVEGRPVLVISIMPVLRNFTECGWKDLGRPATIRRGVRFVTSYQYDANRDPLSAALLVRSRSVKLAMLARAPVVVVSGAHEAELGTSQLRMYVPYDALAPNVTGDVPHVELLIWSKAGGEPDHIPLPPNIMRAVWWDHLRWRAARTEAQDHATSALPAGSRTGVVRVPSPSDPGLKTAIRLQREGRYSASTTLALERLTDDHLSANDRRIALMSTANSFQVEGDASSAALVANELTATDPCAMSGGTASESTSNDAYSAVTATRAMLDRTRSGARCVAYKPGAVFLRGLMIPGYGQYTSWSPLVGKMVAGATLAGATGSLLFHLQARSLYSTYQATLNGYGPQYFQKAVNAETNARNVAIGTAAFWVATAFEAEIQERFFAIRVAQARQFWIRPTVTSATASGPPVPALASGVTFRFR